MKFKKLLELTLISTMMLSAVGCGKKNEVPDETNAPVETTEVVYPGGINPKEYTLTVNQIEDLHKELEESQKINKDVKAILFFDSGLVHCAVLQDKKDMNKYLYLDWKTGEKVKYGSVTMDPQNDFDYDNMNIVIYGHYIYDWKVKQYKFGEGDPRLVFTALKQLMDKEHYEANKYVTLVMNNEVRYYEVGRVYDCPMVQKGNVMVTPDFLEFNLVYYSEDYFKKYMEQVDKHQYYPTDVEFKYGDHLLTLQTCIQDQPNNREIVLCKEIVRMPMSIAKTDLAKAKEDLKKNK